MPIICPAILAPDAEVFRAQIEKVGSFAPRVQIDLTDGQFAQHQTVKPSDVYWPVGVLADIHLMYLDPTPVIELLAEHKPHLIIIHAEAQGAFGRMTKICEENGIKLGIAFLADTPLDNAWPLIEQADHVLIFSGNLGEFGGHANLDLLSKVRAVRERLPEIEIGWDGGINDQNVAALADAGVDVLNVGGFIQNSPDALKTFQALQRIADETGTT